MIAGLVILYMCAGFQRPDCRSHIYTVLHMYAGFQRPDCRSHMYTVLHMYAGFQISFKDKVSMRNCNGSIDIDLNKSSDFFH